MCGNGNVRQATSLTARFRNSSVSRIGSRYRVWGMLQERVYRVPIRDTDELWKRLVATRVEFQQNVVVDALDQWRKRLEACISAEGGHFEHLL